MKWAKHYDYVIIGVLFSVFLYFIVIGVSRNRPAENMKVDDTGSGASVAVGHNKPIENTDKTNASYNQPFEVVIETWRRSFRVWSSYGTILDYGYYYEDTKHLTVSEAIEAFKKSIIAMPDSYKPYLYLAVVYINHKRFSKAIDALKQAVHIEPDPRPYLFLGYVYARDRLFDEAIAAFKQTIFLEPDLCGVHYNLGVAYQELGRFNEAVEAYKQAKCEYWGLALCNLGSYYATRGRLEEAIKAYKRSIETNGNLKAGLNLGITYEMVNRHDEAIEAYDEALRRQGDFNALYNLGLCYEDAGRLNEAINIYKKLIRINPDFVLAHVSLGFAYLKIGDKPSALNTYKLLKNLAEFGEIPCLKLANQLYEKIQKEG